MGKHARSDQEGISVSRLTGTVERHAYRIYRGEGDIAAAIGELHAITTNPQLLARAVGGTNNWLYPHKRALLEAAGAQPADLDAATALVNKRTGHGDLLANLADSINTLPDSPR
jgi:hypothetical protein